MTSGSLAEAPAPAATTQNPRLNLTPFEDYMIWDDRPGYPMTFVVQLRFTGNLDRQALTAALAPALQRHPLLRSRLHKQQGSGRKKTREAWHAETDPGIEIDWGDVDQEIDLPNGEAIDVSQQAGLRVWVRYDDQQAVLTTQFHHAICDGIGSYQFIGDWLWHYAKLIDQPIDQPLPTWDVKGLRGRSQATYDIENYRQDNGQLNEQDTRQLGRLLLKSMQKLAPPRRGASQSQVVSQSLFPGMCEFEFDVQQHKRLRKAAQDRGQSVNEMLVERMLVTLKEWNQQHRPGSKKPLGIMMPMDLRETDTRVPTAANFVTYAWIRRSPEQCVASDELVDSLREEMVQLKHNRHRTPFMNMTAVLRTYPRWFVRWITAFRCFATAILSNTGDPTKRFNVAFPRVKGLLQAGNLTLQDISGVPPMRRGTRLTASVFTYRRVLKICFRCDPNLFQTHDTQELLDRYVAHVAQLLDE